MRINYASFLESEAQSFAIVSDASEGPRMIYVKWVEKGGSPWKESAAFSLPTSTTWESGGGDLELDSPDFAQVHHLPSQ